MTRTRLILLGTNGGPVVRLDRASPAQVVLVDDAAYLVDCGEGVVRQLVAAGVAPATVRELFITHHHADHNIGYGGLLMGAWVSGLDRVLTAHGPPPLARMTEAFFVMNDLDLRMRAASTGRTALADLVAVEEFADPGVVFEDACVTVTAARVPHPPIDQAYAFRFDGPDRSIVISGDTARSDDLVALAEGADVLVHEVFYPPAIEQMAAVDTQRASTLIEHIVACHTSVDEVGEIASAAGVTTLVLSHFVPGDTSVPDDVWAERARRRFGGEVIVGRDLLEV